MAIIRKCAHFGGLMFLLAGSSVDSVRADKNVRQLRRAHSSNDENARLTVMTRNMYVGGNVRLVYEGDFVTLLAQFATTNYDVRVQGLAQEICDNKPDLIGLQEAYTNTFYDPTGIVVQSIPFVPLLLDATFTKCGMKYSVAASSTNTVLGPIPIDDKGSTAKSKDEDVILVNDDKKSLRIVESKDGRFETSVTNPTIGLTLLRGWCYVDIKINKQQIRFANTHLEVSTTDSSTEPINFAQTQEFLDAVVATTPNKSGLVVVGDLNADPTSRSFSRFLDEELSDAWEVNDTGDGYTCCQTTVLDTATSSNFVRIDHVLYRNSMGGGKSRKSRKGGKGGKREKFAVMSAKLVGDTPFQEETPFYASDHAGVVVKFQL